MIKNALYKVIKLSSAEELGSHIVVQGGTFHNKAVLRAFEEIAGAEVICPDISGVMGAFGAALIARRNYTGAPTPTKMLSLEQIEALTYSSFTRRCGGCANHCMLTVNVLTESAATSQEIAVKRWSAMPSGKKLHPIWLNSSADAYLAMSRLQSQLPHGGRSVFPGC